MIIYTKATLRDVEDMRSLISPEVEMGIILDRSSDDIAQHIRSYILAKEDDKTVGFGALHIHTQKLGEIRSLIVAPTYRGAGIGKSIVSDLVEEGKKLFLEQIFTLTYQKEFFLSMGFKEIPKESLPNQKIWADCIKCKHFPVCDEIALIRTI